MNRIWDIYFLDKFACNFHEKFNLSNRNDFENQMPPFFVYHGLELSYEIDDCWI